MREKPVSTFSHPALGKGSSLAGLTILQIVPRLEAGGADADAIDIAAALAEAGARALVASEGGRLVSELQAKGGIWLPFPARTRNPLAMMLNQRRLARLIESEGVALVHARSRAPAWVAYGAARRTGTPFVTTYHGAYSGSSTSKLRYNSIMAKGDLVIANSVYTASRIAALYPFAAGNIRIVERGIDFRVFNPADVDPERVTSLRHAWGVATEERIVLLPARLSGRKGHKVLIEAARLLVAAGLRGTKFILAGDDRSRGSYIREIDAAIAQAGLAGTVSRTGHCNDMPAALLAAAVAVVPSLEPEAFGRVGVEAQAMGTPVVVSDQGGLPEIVQQDSSLSTGWCVPAGDPGALAEAIAQALALGAAARDALSLRARSHVLSRFSLEHMQAETLAAYAALIAAQG
ncbi:MAG TPA: glycosyltransferase family 4 protein [Methylovirgula sp.]|nr:glycosyltransferase family 4 protein [Methylovirgula sp.]